MPPEPDTCVIVPTIRDYDAMRAYFENARDHNFDLERVFVVLVTEDFCDTRGMRAMLDDEGVSGAVFDESARERWFDERGLSEYSHLIPEASHAQTSFGLLYLWANERFDYGFFIDDDTRPLADVDFFGTHLRNLEYEGLLPAVESDEDWVNVLHQSDTDLYPRGYPYAAMGEERVKTEEYVDGVVASQGLWTNVPDLDAVRILMDGDLDGQAQTRTSARDYEDDFVAADGNYLTVCSMNLAFHREIVPAFYQLPMDDNEWGIARFDDIWSGLFLKRACDDLGRQIYNGDPLCRHDKAPRSTFEDLQNEVAGLELNEHLWHVVDDVDVDAESFAEVYRAIADELVAGDYSDWNNGAFLNYCGRYMQDWLECLDEIEERRETVQPVMADD
ncbi:Reversibly glycosylated polypeptide (RGP) familyprotein [Halanaeroarchaeum sp. HSR-CO]|uniref:alpha-1 4-glucan-protein synthase n=1 Tax=Halanaeroarchaeum sp. HSR-CO TaxID=2866382 RepID=UPI00217E0DE5|nr:alpha-1 4-glucan-protein synthase [Halanaeroarchaeum sp. HSR-CO]UWG47853.1 Reversibly glycosylated polypeptide (RGP) familyprotein [Halanaeroarchaeum sp. HSR-CO]